MTRHVFLFLGTFLVGVLLALGARTARHQPHGKAAAVPAPESRTQAATAPDHAGHASSAVPSTSPTSATPVNTVCAICGMPVDPKLPTATYQGKTIGFGCKMCPPKFKAEPEKYGPLYLRNEVLSR